MTDAPDIVFVDLEIHSKGPMTAYKHIGSWPGERHEYTRSDLIPAMIAEAVAREREACAGLMGRALDALTSGAFDISDPRIDAVSEYIDAIRARGQS